MIKPKSALGKPNGTAVKDLSELMPLVTVLNYLSPQNDAVITFLKNNTSSLSVKANTVLHEAGSTFSNIYFIKTGAMRGFVKEGRKDITTWISADNELVTSITNFDTGGAAFENIQAIEDCELLVMTNEALNTLYDKYPVFNITGRKLLQQYYRDAERRALIVRLSKAENRYRFFLDQYNHLANRIQLRYIASYLGITLETLSRIRKKLAASSR